MKDLSFKEAIDKLEEILEKLEQGELSLEEMIEKYEKAVELTAICNKKLNQAKKKVKILFEKKGKFQTKDFEPENE